MEKYTIVFLGHRLCGWGGGIDYLCQIVSSYSYIKHCIDNIEIEMLTIMPYIDDSNSDAVLRKHTLETNLINIEPSMMIHSLEKGESLEEKIVKLNPDLIIPYHCGAFRNISIPYISYIPDFQEEYYREFFSAYEIVKRRQLNSYVLSHAPYILATSRSVAQDINRFYPNSSARVFVQPFAPLSSSAYWDTGDVSLTKYALPGQYFVISNQFWMHKDHMTAFRAIKLLIQMGYRDVCLVCTGKMEDYRNFDYQKTLKEFISDNVLGENIKLLGYIPKNEQIEIMKNAMALIQPSWFEGDPGGCSVYEAVSYGKTVIMADTAVNMEAKGMDGIYYFKTGNSRDLAMQMKKILDGEIKYRTYSIEMVKKIYEKNAKTITEFYLDVARQAVKR